MFRSSDDQILSCPSRGSLIERRWKPNVEIAPNCPRCASSNTKFCYYNNYSLSQPRYFCKGCRRYWTKGGSLRNVPVGGGCRKNRRGKSVRLPPSEQDSINYSRTVSSSNLPQNGLENGEGSSIDLAVVFSKFLNQNSGLDPEIGVPELPNCIHSPFNLSNHSSSSPVQFQEEQRTHVESEMEIIGSGSSREILGEFSLNPVHHHQQQQQQNQMKISELSGSCQMGNGFQSLWSDEIIQDVLWSEVQTVPNFTWQSSQQIQGLEPVMADDNFSLYPNLLNNNWSSFDL